ncbi:MAG: hypothetical protein J5658_14490 [Prevotella sp.]|nr:hypothetical protein [Prevotella sp.]
MKIYRKISVLAMAALVGLAGFTSCSDDSLDTNQYNKSGVNILGFGPMPITRGETMRVTGTNLNNVKEVLFPEGNQKLTPATTFINGSFQLKNSEEMIVTIPDQCVPGKLRLLTNDGKTIVSASNITFSEEIKVVSFSPSSIHPGDILTITGEYVWNIGQVVFYNHVIVNAEDFIKNTRNEIQVRVPMEAKTGDVTCNDGSDNPVNIAIGNLEIDAAQATGVSNANPEFGETITITGENLDLVTSIDFPAVENVNFETAADGKSITVQVPANTISGTVVLTSASGLTTSVNITVPLATVSSTSPVKDVKAGQTITIKGTNLDRITHLTLPAIDAIWTDFTKTATQITFIVPEGMGDGKVILVQHGNYSVESDKISMYSEAPETVIWAGNFVIGNWNAGMQDLAWGGFDWSTVKAGQVLTVYLTPDMSEGWSQIRVGNGSWAALPGTSDVNPLTGEDTKFSVTLTQAMIDEMVKNGGLVICGAFFKITKITLSILENTIWSGSFKLGSWEAGMQELAWGGYDWSKVKEGTTLKLYYEVDSSVGYINIRFGNGSWVALPSTKGWGQDGNASPDPSETSIKTVLTKDDMNELINNGGLVICGAGIIVKKIVLL